MRSKFYFLLRQAALASLAVFGMNEASAQYCTPMVASGCSADYINAFSTSGGITNISNNNTGCSGALTYYSTQTHTTVLNGTVNFSFTNGADGEYYKIWVDYNGDQDYLDAGEEVYNSGTTKITGSTPVTGSFIVPPTATPGTTRMRIRCNYSNNTFTSCSNESFGEAEDYVFVIQGTPCTTPSNPAATNITSSTATLSWTGVSGALGYQYVLNTTQAPPTATPTNIANTTLNVTGLTPSTTYWLHVRTQCNSTSISMWVDYSFTTLPPCKSPVGFKVTNLTPTSATVNWNPWPSAISYDYLVDLSRANPSSATSLTNTASTSANIAGLTENTKYYVHIRSNCAGNEQSTWSLDSFTTPVPCRAPVIKVDHINIHSAVAFWDPVPSSMWYEYAITNSSAQPPVGTRYNFTSIQTAALNDGDDYYIHVRCNCKSVGIESVSPWGTASFKTFPTSVNNINNKEIGIKVYPNPVKDKLVLEISGNRDGAGAVVIMDLAGKTVREIGVQEDKMEINVAGLPAGLYMLKYKDQSTTEVLRIIKQ